MEAERQSNQEKASQPADSQIDRKSVPAESVPGDDEAH